MNYLVAVILFCAISFGSCGKLSDVDPIIVNNVTEPGPPITKIDESTTATADTTTINVTTSIPTTSTTQTPSTTSVTPTSTPKPTPSPTTSAKPTDKTTTEKPTDKPTKKPLTTTLVPSSTMEPVPPTMKPKPASGGFSGPSFIGGIILTLALLGIAFAGHKFYKTRSEMNYHTL